MLSAYYHMLFSTSVRVRIRFSVWLVSSYAHICILSSVVLVAVLDLENAMR